MKPFKHTGCKYLAKLLGFFGFLLNYLGLIVSEGISDLFMAFAIYPSISFFTGLAIFIFIRVICMLKKLKKKNLKWAKKQNSDRVLN